MRKEKHEREQAAVGWHGLFHLHKAMLFATGLLLARAKARELGAEFDDGASTGTSTANLHTLIEGRSDAAVLVNYEGAVLAG